LHCRILCVGFGRIETLSESPKTAVRPLTASDVPAAFRLSADSGWNQTAEDWQMLIDLSPQGCMAIDVNGELAATATLICYGQTLAWIGMVLTKPQHRGQGFARRLLTEALDRADQLGIATVKLDATDQGQPIYEKLGFQSELAVERWSRPTSSNAPEIIPNASASPQPNEGWRSLDTNIFGADRSRVLTNLSQRNPPLVIESSYLLTRPGRKTAYLGPCVSRKQTTALTLIERVLRTSSSGWSWDLFPDNADAVAIARSFGFAPARHLVRMFRGKNLPTNTNATYAIAGFELG
jgi:GNAT superfamily N-acetyltransferase